MANVLGVHYHEFSGSVNGEIMAMWKTGVMHAIYPQYYWFRGPGIQLSSNTGYGFFASFRDEVYLAAGITNPVWNYDGSIWTTTNNVVNAPKAKFIKAFQGRVYLYNLKINETAYPSRCWFSEFPKNDKVEWGLEYGSDLVQTAGEQTVTSATSNFKTRGIKIGDPILITSGDNVGEYTVSSLGDVNGDNEETTLTLTEALENTATGSSFWVGGNWFDVEDDDRTGGTGIGEDSNELLFFKKDSVSRYDPTAQKLTKMQNAPGTMGQGHIVVGEGRCYWLNLTGIYRANGGSAEKISTAIDDLTVYEDEGSFNGSGSIGWYDIKNKEVNWFVGIGGITAGYEGDDSAYINSVVLSFDTASEIWTVRDYGINFASAASVPARDDNYLYPLVGGTRNDVYLMSNYNNFVDDLTGDTDLPINSFIETREVFPAGENTLVTFNRLVAYIENGPDVSIHYKLIYKPTGLSGQFSSDVEWRPLSGNQREPKSEWTFPPDSRACGVKLKIVETSASARDFVLEKLSIYYSTKSNY